jgi:SAM-dependent methyltransferase
MGWNIVRRTRWQVWKDTFFSPLRLLFLSDEMAQRLGLTSLEDERIGAVSACVRGRLLDIGAGSNRLVREYGNGIGVDVFDWSGGALIVEDTSRLPFADGEFDTISFVASLNHIPNRAAVLREARRLLAPGGQLLVTMIGPVVGFVGHRLFWWYSEDKTRGMATGETYGLSVERMRELAADAGFVIARHSRFVYGLNHLYELREAISQPNEMLSSKSETHQ